MKSPQQKRPTGLTDARECASTQAGKFFSKSNSMADAASSAALEVPRILRLPDVEKLVGLKRQQIWNLESEGRFPRRFKILCSRVNGWSQEEVHEWCRTCINRAREPVGSHSARTDGLPRKVAK